ncbi:MAG: hypothetical protein LBM18_01180 [Oscillospiraceae bacterium]|nr:hypothetical protein [Oscillospiraceae bacterium]
MKRQIKKLISILFILSAILNTGAFAVSQDNKDFELDHEFYMSTNSSEIAEDIVRVDEQSISQLSATTITNPSYNGQILARESFTVQWGAISNATYTISLRNLTTDTPLINNVSVYTNSREIPVSSLVAGHQYRVAVSSTVNNQTEWSERTFAIQLNAATITTPSTNGSSFYVQDLTVSWSTVPYASYYLSLRNTTTNQPLLSNVSLGNEDSYTINSGNFTYFQNYRVAIATQIGSQTVWAERTFIIRPATVTRYYSLKANTSLSLTTANGIMNTIQPAFFDTYRINLVRQSSSSTSSLNMLSGCSEGSDNMCYPSICGNQSNGSDCKDNHHKSSSYFLDVGKITGTNVFRFVDYRLCLYGNSSHIPVNGAAIADGRDIIVSTRYGNIYRTAAHEVSHLYGAPDGSSSNPCTPASQLCMMSSSSASYNQWCTRCRNIIISNRTRT